MSGEDFDSKGLNTQDNVKKYYQALSDVLFAQFKEHKISKESGNIWYVEPPEKLSKFYDDKTKDCNMKRIRNFYFTSRHEYKNMQMVKTFEKFKPGDTIIISMTRYDYPFANPHLKYEKLASKINGLKDGVMEKYKGAYVQYLKNTL